MKEVVYAINSKEGPKFYTIICDDEDESLVKNCNVSISRNNYPCVRIRGSDKTKLARFLLGLASIGSQIR